MVAGRLIMIGGWTHIYQLAKACNFHITLVQHKPDIQAADLALVDEVISSELADKNVVEVIETIHKKYPFHAVVSFAELGLLNAALIRERLGLAGNPLGPVLLTRDKGKMREKLREAGIASIPHAIVADSGQVHQFGHQCGWPIILKPANGSGSRQIHKLYAPGEAAAALESIQRDAAIADAIKHDFPSGAILAEKFVSGPEISVESISWDGKHTMLAVTDKITTGYPRFVETGHTMPSALASATLSAVESMVHDFLDAIGHTYGPAHTEIIISDDGPVIVESHTRTGGDRIFEMVELTVGVDMFDATLRGFAGGFPQFDLAKRRAAAIRFLTPPAGRIAAIDGVDAAIMLPGVVRCEIGIKVGEVAKAFNDSDQRYGYVLATGDSREEAVSNVERALAQVKFSVEDVHA